MKNEVMISVVLPVYNGAKYISESIDSILAQTYNNWELIIVNDCSTDETEEIVKSYTLNDDRISYITNEVNQKLPNSLNIGFKLTKGELLTWTSDDNIFHPEAFEYFTNAFQAKGSDFIFSSYEIIDEFGAHIINVGASDDRLRILEQNIVGACFMYKREVYEVVGDYNDEYRLVEDYDYWLRVFSKFQVSTISENLYKYRRHSEALSATENAIKINSVVEKVLKNNYKQFKNVGLKGRYYFYRALQRIDKIYGKNKLPQTIRYIIFRIIYLLIYRLPQKVFS